MDSDEADLHEWYKPAFTPKAGESRPDLPADAALLRGCRYLKAALFGKGDPAKGGIPKMTIKVFVEGTVVKVGVNDATKRTTGYAVLTEELSLQDAIEEAMEALRLDWRPWGGKK